jgi:hypothetical protein
MPGFGKAVDLGARQSGANAALADLGLKSHQLKSVKTLKPKAATGHQYVTSGTTVNPKVAAIR